MKVEWEQKEQSFVDGIAKLEEDSQAQLDEKNRRIEELVSEQQKKSQDINDQD